MDILINERVDAVIGLERTPLPQEGVAGSRSERGRFGRGAGENAGGGGTSGGLVEKYPFEIRFTANQPAFQKVLNDLAASSKQFFITRMLLIENSDPKPVTKQPVATPTPTAGQPVAAASATPSAGISAAEAAGSLETSGGGYLKFIVGTEKLSVAMRIDMVAFNPPEKSNRKVTAPARRQP